MDDGSLWTCGPALDLENIVKNKNLLSLFGSFVKLIN